MSETLSADETLVPIDEVARRFGIKASTIRYYEERGLLDPVSRHSGRRWYGHRELRRLAIIRYWQQSGLMSLEDIGLILAGPDNGGHWQDLVERQVRNLTRQIEKMEAAKSFLEHVASHHDSAPDGCHHYEALIWGHGATSGIDLMLKPGRVSGDTHRTRPPSIGR
jgi:MerR family transcriptional regulator, copper efflux regulator